MSDPFIQPDERTLARQCSRCYRLMEAAHAEPRCRNCQNPEFMLVDVTTLPLFGISLWDDEADDFSSELAADHLYGVSRHLTPSRLRWALRRLRKQWDDVRIHVCRDSLPKVVGQRSLFTETPA